MGMDVKMKFLNTSAVRITPEILSLIAEIDEFKGAWRAIGRIAPERLSSLRRVATIESVGSSTRIEGARLTDREVEKLLANIRLGSFTTRDEQEAAGYAEVMETIFSAYEAISFTENHIRQLHRDLLAHSIKDERHRGAYKTLSNNVEAFNEQGESLGIVFETASPFDTPRRMEELIAWLNEQGREKRLHPLLVVAIFVVVFLEIHPFQDGNGRLSRILTTLLLLQAGYAYVPYSSLESIIEQSKESYYISLRRTQGTIRSAEPDWNPWIEFFLRALHRQKIRLEKKMERERIILADMPELSVALLELAREHGRITVAEAARITHASRHTIKDHLKALVDKGHLVLHGAGRGAWYGLA
ncbi:Fic family protein [Agrobacterium rubi]|uniref:Fic family protein n=2 Tax=Agrobacterium rubi TaxID=28099 RepID=A0AAE7UQM5_9HYPH|nr:Fic family protein [Agrobacterium rubi]NTF05193.1 Fic family protein [Agrobacterium rubi]NTF37902.1 Fic family protein [Agrobacterium rubi]OCJ54153.1 AsnC family transcriptional regulator [Agrobacterium rubi]QTG01764.1 Fic family protein [Agrobacterium rubi]